MYMHFLKSFFGSRVINNENRLTLRGVFINEQKLEWTSVYHYALDIYKCNITVHYYIHRVYTTNSIFTSFLFTYILVLSENSTYTFKYKIKVLSSLVAAVQISVCTSSQYCLVLLQQSLTQSMEHETFHQVLQNQLYIGLQHSGEGNTMST